MPSSHVIIGRIGKPHGVKGWLKLNSFTHPPTNIFEYPDWEIKLQDNWQTAKFEKTQIRGEKLFVKFKDYDNPEDARQLTNCDIRVERTALPDLADNEYYWSDLEGLTVINQDNIELGQVSQLMATGSNDVLIVKNTEREHLIPFILGEFVSNVDLANQKIYVIWDPEF